MAFKPKTTAPITLDGSAQQVSATKVRTDSVLIYAEDDNTDPVRVGDASVAVAGGSERGIPVPPGKSFSMSIIKQLGDEADINLADLYVRGTVGDKVQVIYSE